MDDLGGTLQAALGDQYALERELGRGGMGAVFLARDTRLHRPVAIKILPPAMAAQDDLRERFLRETRVAASFSHPNIVPVHAVESRDGLLAFVMGYVEGETLGARVKRAGPLPVQEAVRLLQETAWALSYAHGRDIVHRDIKPDNILLERATGRALVTDFGIAGSVAAAPGAGLTRVGEVVGTPHFMSPEQAAGDTVDGRSDLYSLGVVGFFALTGRLPFDAPTQTALMAMHLTQPAPPVASVRPDLPAGLAAVVDRCLAKSPGERWESGEALANALDAERRGAPEIAPPLRIFFQRFNAAALACLGFTALAWRVWVSRRPDNLDSMLVFLLLCACIWGFAVQVVSRMRILLRQGFRYRDVHAAAGAIAGEEETAREAIRNSPDEMRRRRRRRRIAFASLVWPPIALWGVVKYMRTPLPNGNMGVSLPGVLTIYASAIAFGLGVALLATDPLKPNPFVKLQRGFWRGPIGRLLFRIAGWRIVNEQDATATTATGRTRATHAGPATVLAAMPKPLRRGLGDAEPRVRALEQEYADLGRRELDLAAAIAETTGDSALGMGSAALAAERDAVRDELAAHLAATRDRRETILAALERARLELLRLKGGVGSAESVRRVLEA